MCVPNVCDQYDKTKPRTQLMTSKRSVRSHRGCMSVSHNKQCLLFSKARGLCLSHTTDICSVCQQGKRFVCLSCVTDRHVFCLLARQEFVCWW